MKDLFLLLLGVLIVTAVGSAHASSLTPTKVCEIAKMEAQGALQACLDSSAALVIAGLPSIAATCQSNFTAALAKIDAAATKAGTSCRYIDNLNGTVSDLDTGLMWEQTTGTIGTILASPPVTDVNNDYTWTLTATAPDGTAFTQFLGTLNAGESTDGGVATAIMGCFANHCDWRLPSIVELQGILTAPYPLCSSAPCIAPIFGPTQSYHYWSATAGDTSFAWLVSFVNGYVFIDAKTGGDYVRAVRGGL